MSNVTLLPHQIDVMEQTKEQNKVAYYLDMGLGKTFVGSEKMIDLQSDINLVICQKSKITDWVEHFDKHYPPNYIALNLTKKSDFDNFMQAFERKTTFNIIGIINYELAWRRKELLELEDFTLMLDESSIIQNETAKRSKFVLKMKAKNVILLSGTPTSGKYEKLWSQMNLLDWNISKRMYYNQYIDVEFSDEGYPIVKGYKNVDRLKRKMREHGCVFMKTEEVMDLPKQNFIDIKVEESKEYKKFKKTGIVITDDLEYVGDTVLTKLLYSRMLCGHENENKVRAFRDLVESTEDRLIVFYNFTKELDILSDIVFYKNRPMSFVNGEIKKLDVYETEESSVTFVQYQAGAMGLNLQKANKIIYFTPPLSSELFEQSKKRIHRIGQEKPCFYYQLKSGIEYAIYSTLSMRKNYTDELFRESEL